MSDHREDPIIYHHKFETFLHKFCPELITDDVVNNESFVASIHSICNKILEYKAIQQKYVLSQNYQRKSTDLFKFNEESSRVLNEMTVEMEKASKIVISVKRGMSRILVS